MGEDEEEEEAKKEEDTAPANVGTTAAASADGMVATASAGGKGAEDEKVPVSGHPSGVVGTSDSSAGWLADAMPPSRWTQVSGVAVLRPPPWVPVRAVVHFIGGAFVGAAPQWTYRNFLTALSGRGVWVFATPLATSFDHLKLVTAASESFEQAYQQVLAQGCLEASVPVYGMGHSMGALLLALTGCGVGVPEHYSKRLQGQVLISYNSQSLAGAVPLWRELWTREDFRPSIQQLAERLEAAGEAGAADIAAVALDVAALTARFVGLEGGAALLGGGERVAELYAPALAQLPPLFRDVAAGVDDFAPASAAVSERISAEYPRELPVLLVKFAGDPIDQTPQLERALRAGHERRVAPRRVELRGSHASPNFGEPPDLIDGTDALDRAALGSETPLDAALLRAGAELSALVDAIDNFLESGLAGGKLKAVVATPLPPQPRLHLTDLLADDFRHPLDKRQTRALERIPGLGTLVRRAVSLVELAIYQDNVSSSVLVSEQQYTWLYALLCNACDILNIPAKQRPEVYVRQNSVPNAYTLAVQGRRPFIVVHTALLDLCCERETEVVLAHELGHLKCEHGVWLSAANILVLGAAALPLPARVLQPVLERLQEDLGTWQRAAELSCDRAALLVAQEPWTPLSVLVKLSGGGAAPHTSLEGAGAGVLPRGRLEAFLAQAKRYDDSRASAGPLEAMLASAVGSGRPRTHPVPVLRARELRRWADSEQFRSILCERGVPAKDISA